MPIIVAFNGSIAQDIFIIIIQHDQHHALGNKQIFTILNPQTELILSTECE